MTQPKTIQHKKRFGQFFSGKTVADMLFSLLPQGYKWSSVVDPMVGIGDMLVAVQENTKDCPTMLGIEIDKVVAKKCAERVPNASILCCDAFKNDNVVTSNGFDLVITNPPYVRYQLQYDDKVMPSAREIRENLIRQIQRIPYLSEKERFLFLQLAKNYSGLSDMAVPAWLLCAALVKKNGYLAMVVPETWLNRDYASPIQYLLLKCFRIETIAIDKNASWFPEALVKTCLVVAKRVEIQPLHETEKLITRIIENKRIYKQPTTTLFYYLKGAKEANKWCLSEDATFFSKHLELPHDLAEILKRTEPVEFMTLAEMGIECGQGLRTGANDFFYIKIKKAERKTIRIHSRVWDHGGRDYTFLTDDIIPALQNRGEIKGLVVTPSKLKTGVIYPQSEVKGDLQNYIGSAEKYIDTKGRRFKDYSAVVPNEKKDGDRIVREWFRLPKMANRHLPNLCITRVSAGISECLFVEQNESEPIAIDANMVTIWGHDSQMVWGVFALLNSTWSKLSLELICTVMGGGALKVETSHVKKLLVPKLNYDQLNKLGNIGKELFNQECMTEEIQDKIDNIIASALGAKEITSKMRSLLERKYQERSTRS